MALTAHVLKTDSDVVKTEGPNRYSRDEAIILTGMGVLQPGTVLSRVTASGKLRTLAPAGSDGSQTAVAVLLEYVDATSADQPRTVVLSRHAEVVAQALVWPAGITGPQKAAALTQLETAGIVARRGV